MKFILLLCFGVLSTLSWSIPKNVLPDRSSLLKINTRVRTGVKDYKNKVLTSEEISNLKLNVKKYAKNAIEKINVLLSKWKLGKAGLTEPSAFKDIQITKKGYIGEGKQGHAYNVRVVREVNGKIIGENAVLKTSKPDAPNVKKEFQNEVNALKKTEMLIAFDERTLTVVQKKIEGTSLDKILLERIDVQRVSALKGKYDKLSQDFIDTHGLVHGDIRPWNVIVDSADNLHLIDFGRTKEASFVQKTLDDQIRKDREIATREWDFLTQYKIANDALKNPFNPLTINILKDFSKTLEVRGNLQAKQLIDKTIDKFQGWQDASKIRSK